MATVKALTYNIHGWLTPDNELNLDLAAEVIASSGADLIGLNEVFHPYPTADGPALEALARKLGMAYAFGPTIAADPQQRGGLPYGNALLSRWPILAYAAHHLPPMTDYGQRGLLEARVAPPNAAPFTVYVIHLDHRFEDLRVQEWAAAMTWLGRDRSRPHLLMGDFNALSPADFAEPGGPGADHGDSGGTRLGAARLPVDGAGDEGRLRGCICRRRRRPRRDVDCCAAGSAH